MSIVDRVFTRIGASDRILENKSTFFVELEETKAICELATRDSLVIMDELGRGTSTFDGYSIAHSVLTYLSTKVKCRTLFTTHYHMLVDEFRGKSGVGLFKMACEIDDKAQNSGQIGKVGFHYKFEPGEAKSSFGLYVAKMAGINDKVLKLAQAKSEQFGDRLSTLVLKVGNLQI
jgi:DNA mismatch repair protein MSH6